MVAVSGVRERFDSVYDWIMDERVGGSMLGLRKASRRVAMVRFMPGSVFDWERAEYWTTEVTDRGLSSGLLRYGRMVVGQGSSVAFCVAVMDGGMRDRFLGEKWKKPCFCLLVSLRISVCLPASSWSSPRYF